MLKEFLEPGMKRLAGDIVRQVQTLRQQTRDLREFVTEQTFSE